MAISHCTIERETAVAMETIDQLSTYIHVHVCVCSCIELSFCQFTARIQFAVIFVARYIPILQYLTLGHVSLVCQ